MTDIIDAPDETWVEVGQFPNGKVAGEHALVLVAADIDCQLASRGWGVALRVAAWDAEAARQELAAYAEDNKADLVPPIHRHPARDALTGVLAYWCVMIFMYIASNHDLFGADWFLVGDGQAGLILNGEWWRVITSLSLHANLGHIASNLIAGSLFGFFLAEILGSGIAWLMILLAGAAGNAVNALIQPASHTSIGASTAIFGAVGLLAVVAVRFRPRHRRWGLRRLAPIAAGIMLLAFLGIQGKNIDIGAHVAGFAAGCGLGAVVLLTGQPVPTPWQQAVYATVTAVLFAGAWAVALRYGGGW